jgi:hypothetical protein
MRWSRNCLTPPERHCRTAYLSGSGPPWALAAGWSTGSRRKPRALSAGERRCVRAIPAVPGRLPSWAPVRLSPPSCQLVPAIRNAHAACARLHTAVRNPGEGPIPGIDLSRTCPEFWYDGVSWASASGREGDRGVQRTSRPAGADPGTADGDTRVPPRCTRSKFLAFLPGTAGVSPRERGYQQVSRCVTTSAGVPGPGSGQGINQPLSRGLDQSSGDDHGHGQTGQAPDD